MKRGENFLRKALQKGVMQFAIGLGKKVLLADTLALAVNYGYENIASLMRLQPSWQQWAIRWSCTLTSAVTRYGHRSGKDVRD